jgi:hypothetical protein
MQAFIELRMTNNRYLTACQLNVDDSCVVRRRRPLAVTILFNRECTRINANSCRPRQGGWITPAWSPNGDRPGRGPKLRLAPPLAFIGVHWRF